MAVGPTTRTRLAAYVLTKNEEGQVHHAVASLRHVTDHVLVVDSESTDATREQAERAGASVVLRPFDTFADQRNFAMEAVIERFDPEWILTIDADERLTAQLVDEIKAKICRTTEGNPSVDAYAIRRVVRFEGKLLRFGGVSRTRLVRLYRSGSGRYEARLVNEHYSLDPTKKLGALVFPIEHADVASWERHIAKHNEYSTLEATERARGAAITAAQALKAPYLRRRWLRERVWNRLPAKPLVRFVQMYLFAGGFLDGAPGFDLALFQAWQEMCTEQKYRNLSLRESPVSGPPSE